MSIHCGTLSCTFSLGSYAGRLIPSGVTCGSWFGADVQKIGRDLAVVRSGFHTASSTLRTRDQGSNAFARSTVKMTVAERDESWKSQNNFRQRE